MNKYRFIYNEEKVLSVVPNDTSVTFTNENVIVCTKDEAVSFFEFLGIDMEEIDNYTFL